MPRPAVSILCAMYAGATVLLAFSCAFPLSATAPVTLGLGLLPVGVVVTAVLWFARDRVTERWALAGAALLVALMGALLAAATTPAGVVVDVTGFGWVVAYVALMLPRWSNRFSAAVVIVVVAAVMVGEVPGVWPAVVVLLSSLCMVALALGRLSVGVRRSLGTDPLTGVLNRSGLKDALHDLRGVPAAVAMIDLDAFKAVNDDRGHLAGDRLLAEAAAAWLHVVRSGDLIARTGGDEFVVVMPGTDLAVARRVVERLRRAHPVAFSAGVAMVEGDVDAALDRADRELYAAKARRGTPARAPLAGALDRA